MGINRHKALLDRAAKMFEELESKGYEVENFQAEVPLDVFKGYRIAIDAMPILYKKLSVVHRGIVQKTTDLTEQLNREGFLKQWIQMLIREVMSFLEQGIIPVFVFDGENKSELKKLKWDKNAKVHERTDSVITDLKEQIKNLDILSEEAAKLQEELRKKMGGRFKLEDHEPVLMFNIISSLGIPYVVAESEAEQMCAWLCLNGICEAAYSVDSDTLPFGSPIWIKQITARKATIILLEPLLKILGLTFNQYVELCIASGCDFNNNISKLGILSVYKHIKTCEWIENLPQEFDITPLNHTQCRDIFAIKEDSKFQDRLENINFRPVSGEDIRDILMPYGLASHCSKLKTLLDLAVKWEINPSEVRDPRELFPEGAYDYVRDSQPLTEVSND